MLSNEVLPKEIETLLADPWLNVGVVRAKLRAAIVAYGRSEGMAGTGEDDLDCTCIAPHPACPNCNGTGKVTP